MKMNLTHISKKSKTIAATAFVLGVAAVSAGTFNASTAFADTTSTRGTPDANRTAHITNLVNALAQKFNLNSTEVKTVVDTVMASERATMQANHEERQSTNLAERLAKAVTAGKITQAQSVLITAKIQETKTFMESMKNKTDAERKAAMTTYKANIEAWATTNNIPKEFLNMGGMKQMKGKGHGKFGGEEIGGMMGENR